MQTISLPKGKKEEISFPPASTVRKPIILSHFVGSRMHNVENASSMDISKNSAKPAPQKGNKLMLQRLWNLRMNNCSLQLLNKAAALLRLVNKSG